ncbi:hypothetical protein GCM10025868_24240 [Angustibacter aerolatus]|uniref:Uncharacterized protein n=1 Tax=Angustibacter aerolatus TaxID=1162965 RepID=A0ABQ6JIJ8_9ACTN|nr:hypothetical protein GCM10025868_24240 [Angustibacter aerolatus]
MPADPATGAETAERAGRSPSRPVRVLLVVQPFEGAFEPISTFSEVPDCSRIFMVTPALRTFTLLCGVTGDQYDLVSSNVVAGPSPRMYSACC